MVPSGNMSKQIPFSDFLSKLEEYEHLHSWCAKLIADGRYSIQSVCNNIDSMQLTNLMDSFMKFVILLTQCDPNSLSNVKNSTLIPNECTSKQQNESQDLLPKNDIIKIVNNDLQCPICNEWLLKATSANCNHTFCEMCIQKWLRIKKTCPVCRTPIQYTSTSIAVDNFISNMCHLIGGFIKKRRESVQNAHLDHNINQTIDFSVNSLINDLSISQSIEEDTFVSQLETTTPMLHPNMVRLIPQQSQTPNTGIHLRQTEVNLNIPHPNTVQLFPFPTSSISSSCVIRTQPTSSTSIVSPCVNQVQSMSIVSPRANQVQSTSPSSIISLHPNCVRLLPSTSVIPRTTSYQTTPLNLVNPRVNCVALTSSTSGSPRINRYQTTSSSIINPRVNCVTLTSSKSGSPRINRYQTISSSIVGPRVNCVALTSSTSVTQRINRYQTSSTISAFSPRQSRTQPTFSTFEVNQRLNRYKTK